MLFNFFYAYSLWNYGNLQVARYQALQMWTQFDQIVQLYALLHESWVNSDRKGGVIFPTSMSIQVGPDGPVLRGCSFEGLLLGCLEELLFWDEEDPMVFIFEYHLLLRQRISQALPSAHFCCRCGSVEGVESGELATAMLNLGGVVEKVRDCNFCYYIPDKMFYEMKKKWGNEGIPF